MAIVKLGEVAHEYKRTIKNRSGYPIVGLEHLTPAEIELTCWDENADTTFSKGFKKGHVLFGRRRAYLKKAAVAPFDGICSGDIIVIEANEERIRADLLPFIIQNDLMFDFAMSKSAGGLSPRVKWIDLMEYEFNLPSLSEQELLVELLSAAYETKKSYMNLISQTDEVVKSQFIEMFGDFNTNPRNVPIVEIGDLFDVGSSKRVFQKDWKTEGVPFYRAREIVKLAENGYVDNELFITPEMYDDYSQKYGVPVAGDIMVTGVGTLGVCYLVKETDKFYYKDGNTLCFHNKGNVDSRFILECYKMPFIREQIEANAGGTTVGTYTIVNAKKTKVFNPPMEEQKEFVDFVEQSDKSKFELKKAIDSVNDLIRSIIQQDLS